MIQPTFMLRCNIRTYLFVATASAVIMGCCVTALLPTIRTRSSSSAPNYFSPSVSSTYYAPYHNCYNTKLTNHKIHIDVFHENSEKKWRGKNVFRSFLETRSKKRDNRYISSALCSSTSSEAGNDEDEAKSRMPSSVVNLIKTAVGSGVLALPSGVAALGDVPKALIPSTILMVFIAILSTYSFSIIGRMCEGHQEVSTLGQAWELNVGERSSWIVALSCFLVTFFVSISYSIVLGDTLSSLLKSTGLVKSGFLASRQMPILLITPLVLYPLCCLKSLAALAPFSMIGVGGIFLTAIFMLTRLVTCCYSPGGQFFSGLSPIYTPSFGAIGMKKLSSPSSLILCSMAASSYCAHFSAPNFYQTLQNNTMKRFNLLAILGFSGTMLLNLFIMSFGFLTFGGNSCGYILNNYSTRDFGAMICRFFVGISLIGSYPLMMKGMKGGLIDLIRLKGKKTLSKTQQNKLLPILLSLITSIALILPNAGFVVSFNGALMGSAINYIFPCYMFLKATEECEVENDCSVPITLERLWTRIVMIFGVLAAVAGGAVSVMNTFCPSMLT